MSPLVRAEGYRVLARCFGEAPAEELREDLLAATEAPELTELAALVPLVNDELPEDRVALFGRGVLVSPYENGWIRAVPGVHLGQLATLYELFGARVSGGERVDHLSTELEFAALLSLKEAILDHSGDSEGAARVRAGRKVLMEEHLGRWAPRFCEGLKRATDLTFWHMAAEALDRFLELDFVDHGWVPGVAQDPLPGEGADPLTCPHACEAEPEA
ncbi:chaperone TorD [Deltaproteobacteria bacterium]|nr:chaperone TorD [Deltaproteobacteria bacterium]